MSDIGALLVRFWDFDAAEITPLGGGINSETWRVEHKGSSYVAKRVASHAVAGLVAGCEVAAALAEAGFVTGRPLPTTDGRLVVSEHGLALLAHVPGRELDGETHEDQQQMVSTLAGIHHSGGPILGPGAGSFMTEWLTPERPGVSDHPWLLSAIDAVRAATDAPGLTWSTLHTDPAPEAFLHDVGTGATALIDWAGARRGPVLYDVASAVMYLGGRDLAAAFLDHYASHGPLSAAELARLDAFSRFREVVQGAYFAWRLATHDLTGGIDPAENLKGLRDARERLSELGTS